MSPADRDTQGTVDTDPVLRLPEAEGSPVGSTDEGRDRPSVDPVVRIDEARRRSLRRWAMVGAAAVTIAVVGMSLTATPLFHARTIRVEGERRLSERQVLRAAGVGDATNVFSLDEGAVSRRLERSPWIADADVIASLPSTVTIRVRERIPVAIARTEDGTVWAAADGSILGPAAGAALPEIISAEVAGQTPTPVSPAMVVPAAAAAAEFGPGVRSQIQAIVVQPDATLTLELAGGVTVAYGSASELAAKAEALRAILRYVEQERKDLLTVDLRTPAAPTARFVGVPVVTEVPSTPRSDPPRPEEDVDRNDNTAIGRLDGPAHP
jgi:cell division protein FtsQ